MGEAFARAELFRDQRPTYVAADLVELAPDARAGAGWFPDEQTGLERRLIPLAASGGPSGDQGDASRRGSRGASHTYLALARWPSGDAP